jgi:hypothetical protein
MEFKSWVIKGEYKFQRTGINWVNKDIAVFNKMYKSWYFA